MPILSSLCASLARPALHNSDPRVDVAQDNSFTIFSVQGWANVSVLVLLMAGLITLFAGYPIISFYNTTPLVTLGNNFGGGNGTGQIPELPCNPTLIDNDTDKQFYKKLQVTELNGIWFSAMSSIRMAEHSGLEMIRIGKRLTFIICSCAYLPTCCYFY